MLFSEVEKLGSGGRSERRKVGFTSSSVSAVGCSRRVAVRWKINKGAMLRSQSRKNIFFSLFSQARGLVLFLVFQALRSSIERHYVQSGAAFLSFPRLRWNVASWAGGGINCKNVST